MTVTAPSARTTTESTKAAMHAAQRSNGPREAHNTSTRIQGEQCFETSADRPCSPRCRSSHWSPPRAAAMTTTTVPRAAPTPSSPRTRPRGDRGHGGHRGRPRAPRPTEGTEATEGTGEGDGGGATDEGEPVKGGTLVYGLEADTANAWAHYRASCATSGYVPLSADHRLAVRRHRGGRDRPAARRVGRAQRRLHRVDAARSARASRSTTARRSTARRSSSTSTPAGPPR